MDFKQSLKNILKEFSIIAVILIILVSFLTPVLTMWHGLFYEIVLDEVYFIGMKTTLYFQELKDGIEFVWNAGMEGLR